MAPPVHLAERFHPWQLDGWKLLVRMLYLAFFAARSQRKRIRVFLEWARQCGKNELAAAFQTWWMLNSPRWLAQGKLDLRSPPSGGPPTWDALHTAPTWKPGIVVAKRRLESYLRQVNPDFGKEDGVTYRIAPGSPVALSLASAGPTANRRSMTASAFLWVDEVQLTSHAVYGGELHPMCASTGGVQVYTGTRWTRDSLGTKLAQELAEEQAEDGIPRYLRVPASLVAEHNENYAEHYAQQVARMGAKHPIIQGEYDLVTPDQVGAFLEPEAYDRLCSGLHPARDYPTQGKTYVAGVDFCGAAEEPDEHALDPDWVRRRDSTCVRVGQLGWRIERAVGSGDTSWVPEVQVVATLLLPGQQPETVVDKIEEFLRRWQVTQARGDGGGVGDGPCAMLSKRLPGMFETLKSGSMDVRRMGLRLLGAINSGRFKLWHEDGPPGALLEESRKQYLHLRKEAKEGGLFRWGHPKQRVNGENIHDDIPKADGLMLEAAYDHLARVQPAVRRPYEPYDEGAGYDR